MYPRKVIVTMLCLLVFLFGAIFSYLEDIKLLFLMNIPLNSLLCTVLFLGILMHFYRALSIKQACDSVETGALQISHQTPPSLLSPFANIALHKSGISSLRLDVAVDGVARIGLRHGHMHQYIMRGLAFLSVAGVFIGLLFSINSMGELVLGLPLNYNGMKDASFVEQLKQGLHIPLAGMGTALSPVIFGLFGCFYLATLHTLVSGLWSSFFHQVEMMALDMEETHVINKQSKHSQPVNPGYLHAMIRQTQEQIERIVQVTENSHATRNVLENNILQLSQKMSKMIDQREIEKKLLMKIAEGHVDLQHHLQTFKNKISDGDFGIDPQSRKHIADLSVSLHRLGHVMHDSHAHAKETHKAVHVIKNTLAYDNPSPSHLIARKKQAS